ncbi:hypothetical protein BaRGS_00022295 [Batillaria attramentaria]|uniref:Uncharacterized protein n=1 Tax=Batillaria attramentaria TaxID=370345 RepID=A0ABD0KH87_9CAEN
MQKPKIAETEREFSQKSVDAYLQLSRRSAESWEEAMMKELADCCAVFKGSEGSNPAPVCADVNKATASTAFIQALCHLQWRPPASVKPAVPGTRFMQALQQERCEENRPT